MDEPSLPLLLRRLAREVRTQEAAVRDLHGLALAAGPAFAHEAQGIDVASQHLAEIAGVLQRLSDGADGPAPGGVVEPVALAALRDRLLGRETKEDEGGEIDFF